MTFTAVMWFPLSVNSKENFSSLLNHELHHKYVYKAQFKKRRKLDAFFLPEFLYPCFQHFHFFTIFSTCNFRENSQELSNLNFHSKHNFFAARDENSFPLLYVTFTATWFNELSEHRVKHSLIKLCTFINLLSPVLEAVTSLVINLLSVFLSV